MWGFIAGLVVAALVLLLCVAVDGCGPAVPRPTVPSTTCQPGDHEVRLPDGGVAVCAEDPMNENAGLESDFPGFTYTGRRVVRPADGGVR